MPTFEDSRTVAEGVSRLLPADTRHVPHPALSRLLIIEDDRDLCEVLKVILEREGITLDAAHTASGGLQAIADAAEAGNKLPDLILLDLMLPDRSGIELCRDLRTRWPRLPLIMLTAKGDPIDRAIGLEVGADDYLPKPFDPRELIARVRAVLRRVEPHASATEPRLVFGDAVIDFTGRSFTIGNVQVQLSAIEFKLLAALARQPGVPLSREALTRAAQLGTYAPLERAVDVQIARLRKKLRHAAPQFEWVRTVRGEGYTFAPPGSK